jgi:hypothetical protein
MEDILVKNDYKFIIKLRILEDFNGEQYKRPEDLSENLISNDDFLDTLESFLDSLLSMYDTYDTVMSRFVLECMIRRAKEYGYKTY